MKKLLLVTTLALGTLQTMASSQQGICKPGFVLKKYNDGCDSNGICNPGIEFYCAPDSSQSGPVVINE